MTQRYYAAVVASSAPRFKGWGSHVEVHNYRYAKRNGPKKLYVWFFDKAIGPKKLFAFMRHVRDASSSHVITGPKGHLASIIKGSTTAKGSVRASKAQHGAKRKKLSEAKRSKRPTKIRQQIFMLKKHLTRKEAYAIAKRRARRDYRGFTYSPSTGRAALT